MPKNKPTITAESNVLLHVNEHIELPWFTLEKLLHDWIVVRLKPQIKELNKKHSGKLVTLGDRPKSQDGKLQVLICDGDPPYGTSEVVAIPLNEELKQVLAGAAAIQADIQRDLVDEGW